MRRFIVILLMLGTIGCADRAPSRKERLEMYQLEYQELERIQKDKNEMLTLLRGQPERVWDKYKTALETIGEREFAQEKRLKEARAALDK